MAPYCPELKSMGIGSKALSHGCPLAPHWLAPAGRVSDDPGRAAQAQAELPCGLGGLARVMLLGSWYILAVASGEKDFVVEKATKNIEGVVVTLTPDNTLKMLSSRHRRPHALQEMAGLPSTWAGLAEDKQGQRRLERCHLHAVELVKQNSRWVFGNPSLGVLEYRVLGTNFRDYAIVLTQLELQDEAFSTVELYSRTELASQEAMGLFTKWSRSLGFRSQQQAKLQKDRECRRA
ncbi:hypothetical protein J1605_017292 [Eschrichtius robustus]|uniref:Epididymal-specific lipocalin-6 n=1 Tax=Eschrichtius robustus TaxID=9764 RepID=A0AB34I275_ESCRO|nr:hypothetical protein J1605_017292 [Eschrichtius robustus]